MRREAITGRDMSGRAGMLNWLKKRPWFSAFIAFAVLFSAFFTTSFHLPFQYNLCTYSEHTSVPECSEHHLGPYALLWVIEFVDQHNGFVTAVATIAIAAFTFTLYETARDQGRLALESIELARQEFIASHRPRLVVRFIQGPFVENSEEPHQFIWVTVANVGTNRANIVTWGADLARRKGPNWEVPGLNAEARAVDPDALLSGERRVFTVRAAVPYGDTQIFEDAFSSTGDAEKIELCAVGSFRYADESNIIRETGFFRVYDPDAEAFIPSKNPENEYQD